jgi:hypothetical protein
VREEKGNIKTCFDPAQFAFHKSLSRTQLHKIPVPKSLLSFASVKPYKDQQWILVLEQQ